MHPPPGRAVRRNEQFGLQRVRAAPNDCAEPCLDVTRVHEVALCSELPPNSGEAVRLQLLADGKGVARFGGQARAFPLHLLRNADQELHMMAEFVLRRIRSQRILCSLVDGGADQAFRLLMNWASSTTLSGLPPHRIAA